MAEFIIDMPNDYPTSEWGVYCPDERDDPMPIGEPIVRCRDCKHSYEDRRCTSTGWVDVLVCGSKQWSTSSLMPNHTVKDDGFCAWDERRED